MRKVLLLIVFVLLLSGCTSEKEVLVDKDSGLVGIWSMTSSNQSKNDDSIVDKLSFQFKEDGSCIYSYSLLVGTNKSMTMEGKAEGICYLNDKNNKLIMKSEPEKNNVLFSKWNSFKLDDYSLTIGDFTFTKVG